MPFGKHRGERISDLPLDYLLWLRDNIDLREPLRTVVAFELRQRLAPPPPPHSFFPSLSVPPALRPMVERIRQAGFRALSLKLHPDQGGTNEEMRRLLEADKVLRSIAEGDA